MLLVIPAAEAPAGVPQLVNSSDRISKPTGAEILSVWPPKASAKALTTGRGVARCVVSLDGARRHCTPDVGVPNGLGFSEAAVKLASSMKMNPWTLAGGPMDATVIGLPIRSNLAKKK